MKTVATVTDTRLLMALTRSSLNIQLEKCTESTGSWTTLEIFEKWNMELRGEDSSPKVPV